MALFDSQKIYHITPSNKGQILPNIRHSSSIMSEIRDALNAGKHIITHTDSISIEGWKGVGYIFYDPEVGSGAYKIAGGLNGGYSPVEDALIGILDFLIPPAKADKVAGRVGYAADAASFIDALGDCNKMSNFFAYVISYIMALPVIWAVAKFQILFVPALIIAVLLATWMASYFVSRNPYPCGRNY